MPVMFHRPQRKARHSRLKHYRTSGRMSKFSRSAPRRASRRWHAENLSRAAARVIREPGVELIEMEETFGFLQLIRSRLNVPVVVRLHGPAFANGEASETVFGPALQRRVREE